MLFRFACARIVIKSLFPILTIFKNNNKPPYFRSSAPGGRGGPKIWGFVVIFRWFVLLFHMTGWLIMIRDGFRCFSRERRIKSKKAWIDSFSNVFSTGSLYVDPRQKIVWSVKNSRMNTLKFCIFPYYFDYVFVECVYINISDHMNSHFHWK